MKDVIFQDLLRENSLDLFKLLRMNLDTLFEYNLNGDPVLMLIDKGWTYLRE